MAEFAWCVETSWRDSDIRSEHDMPAEAKQEPDRFTVFQALSTLHYVHSETGKKKKKLCIMLF